MKKLLVSLLFVYTSVMSQEATDEQLPVVCGSLQDILSAAKTKYNETPIATWRDPRFGRFFLLSNPEGDSVTQILAVEGVDNSGCVISAGSELLLKPHKKPMF